MLNTLLEPGFNAPIKTWLPVEEIDARTKNGISSV